MARDVVCPKERWLADVKAGKDFETSLVKWEIKVAAYEVACGDKISEAMLVATIMPEAKAATRKRMAVRFFISFSLSSKTFFMCFPLFIHPCSFFKICPFASVFTCFQRAGPTGASLRSSRGKSRRKRNLNPPSPVCSKAGHAAQQHVLLECLGICQLINTMRSSFPGHRLCTTILP